MKYSIPKYEFKKGGKAKVARSLFNKVKKPKAVKSVKSIKDKIDFTGVESLTFDEANAWIKANPDLRLGRGIDPNIGRPSYQNSGKIIVDGKQVNIDSNEYRRIYEDRNLMNVDKDGMPIRWSGEEAVVTAQMTDKERQKRNNLYNAAFPKMNTDDGLDEQGNYIYYDNPSGKGSIDSDLGNAGLALMELTGIPSLYRVSKDPLGHLQSALKTIDGISTLGTMPSNTYNTPEDLSKALDIVGASGTVSSFVKPVASGLNQVAKTFKPSYMSLDAPMGKMFGQNQVLTQQSRLLDPKIKAKYFEHQAPPSGPKKDMIEKISPDYNNRITNENYEDFVNNIHGSTDYDLSKNFGKQPKNLGIGSYGSPGAVFSDAPLSNLQKDIINAHEKNHGIFAGTLSSKMKSDLRKPFPTNKPIPNYSDKHQADEILARMAQFKNAIGMSDNQVFTLGHLNYIRNNYSKLFTDNSITAMLSKIKPGSIGEKQFLKNMNKYAFGIGVPATIATGAATIGGNMLPQQKYGGKIPYTTLKYKYGKGGNIKSSDEKVKCNCGWSWNISDGGDDPYVCHKCGHDNSYKKAQLGLEINLLEASKNMFSDYNPVSDDYTAAMNGMMKARMAIDSTLGRNPAAIRMTSISPKQYRFTGDEMFYDEKVDIPAGATGTHYTTGDGNVMFPIIQEGKDGNLFFNRYASPYDREAMRFESPEEAEYFGMNYKNIAPMMYEYKKGGNFGGLNRWFAEKWVDVKTGKPCGRQEGESRRSYPACRPSVRVNNKTPKTSSELSSFEKEKFKRSKTSSQRIKYQHKRNK
jgi:hypothetical protein